MLHIPCLRLQEVIRNGVTVRLLLRPLLYILVLVILRRGRKYIKETLARIAHFQHTRHVSATVAVVGRAPYCAQVVVV